MSSQPFTVAMLKEVTEAFNRHDLEAIMQFFADEASMDVPRGSSPWGTRYVGKEEIRRGIAARFEGIPDVHYGADHHWLSQDGGYGVSEWTLTGTRADGLSVELRGCDHWQFKDARIVRKDSYWKIVE